MSLSKKAYLLSFLTIASWFLPITGYSFTIMGPAMTGSTSAPCLLDMMIGTNIYHSGFPIFKADFANITFILQIVMLLLGFIYALVCLFNVETPVMRVGVGAVGLGFNIANIVLIVSNFDIFKYYGKEMIGLSVILYLVILAITSIMFGTDIFLALSKLNKKD